MHATERNNRSRTVYIPVPVRFFLAAATALLLVTLVVSSTAHGLVLGEATAQSALGSPLRVVIPVTAGPGEALRPGCFQVVPAAGEGSAAIVTARVSVERAAAAPRLVVTTANAVNEPAIRFSIQSECDGLARHGYVLLLDPPQAGLPAAATTKQATARESRQERLAPQPATVRRNPVSSVPTQTQVVHAPGFVDHDSPPATTAPAPSVGERGARAGAVAPLALRQVAATSELPVPIATLPPRVQPAKAGGSGGWLLGAGIAVLGALALASVLAFRRNRPPEIPQWTRGPSYADTRTFSEFSTAQATLSHTVSQAGATTSSGGAEGANRKSATPSRLGNADVTASRLASAPIDPSTIDSLLDTIDSDFVEERAVREAWAAARSDVERELNGNEILQAIEAAERDLHFAPPPPAQAAIERALEDDLLQPPQPR
jgi:hypothetical protein